MTGADRPKLAKRDANWEAQLAKLEVHKRRHLGDCNVPRSWAEDPPLGRWVHSQRMLKKVLDRGEPSEGMTAARVAKLDALGFVWESAPWKDSDADLVQDVRLFMKTHKLSQVTVGLGRIVTLLRLC